MDNRPNIVTIGVLVGGLVQLIVFAYNQWALIDLGPSESAALVTVLTGLTQYCDRWSKRSVAHVIQKYNGIDRTV